MNDSKTIELYKHGQWGRAVARTAMYASGLLLSLFLLMLLALAIVLLIMSPAMAFVLDQYCKLVWGA